jgi:23S rRNA pseudouridine1911/1915/1917 synthase
VIPNEEGQTLTILLSRRLPDTTRSRAKEIIKAGGVYVNKLRVRIPSVRVVAGERITVYPDASAVEDLDPESLRFVHRDPSFVVLDKPAGLPVSQTKQSARGTLAAALRAKLESEGVTRPYVGVVHRLDLHASGLVLFTIRGVANKSLHQQFTKHSIERDYRVLVHGQCEAPISCDASLHVVQGRRVRVVEKGDERAQSALTHFRPLRSGPDGTTLLEARIETGRTHQIRAHAAHLGLPIVGDRRYGRNDDEASLLHLHAHRLRFAHPLSGELLDLSSELPNWARD